MSTPPHPQKLRHLTLIDRIGSYGGAERLAIEVAKRLPADRFERTVCATRWSAHLESRPSRSAALEDLRGQGVGFLGLHRRNAADVLAWRRLIALLRRQRVHILHAHKFGSNVWASVLGPLAGTPVVVAHEHSWAFDGGFSRTMLDRHLIAARCDAVVAVSREDRRRMIETEGMAPEKVVHIPNGIPAPPPSTGELRRADLDIEEEDLVIGTVGVLRSEKAIDVLVRVMAGLRSRVPRLHLLIVGSGPERGNIEGLIQDLGLSATVHLLGYRTDVPDLLRIFDVAVSCSQREGSPISVLEYMEAGLPVVATRVGGIPDLVRDRVTGLLVEPGDERALADALCELLQDPGRRVEMGHLARDRRRREFDIDVTVRRLVRLYEELVAAKVAAP